MKVIKVQRDGNGGWHKKRSCKLFYKNVPAFKDATRGQVLPPEGSFHAI